MPSQQKLPIVVLLSGSGSNLQAIIDAALAGSLDVDIRAVISNKAAAYGLQRAQQAGIETRVLEHTSFDSREAFDRAMIELINTYQPGLVVLAGFMRILSDTFVDHYHGRLLNIHPSLLPKYQGLNTHQRAIEAGDDEAGASVHFVSPELDGGPVIMQASIPLQAGDDAESLAQRVLGVEHKLYPQAIQLFAAGEIEQRDNQVFYKGEPLNQPLSLNPEQA
ncbi:MAG: phosphoribosylglycinamide formyltransferase [Gammaproteobacteria bacterium]|nr:phosphoribosylglycinamide formyltransferase [Gammaproteobacteria bacterium]